MNNHKIRKIITGLEHVADSQDTPLLEILDALIGVCFDEEEAGKIKNYFNYWAEQD